ncbi:C5-sterol desaturase [Rhodocollybia butyracea]|uniref:C5-sterol desaturase n=1 Tax=Rhodocollybia butyracea TaxID=206335 RepID=A0A9P5Q066_9AGAR|nr:C5-sterol desaturase [Rhodocollybia butyracea]
MDLILEAADTYLLDAVYTKLIPTPIEAAGLNITGSALALSAWQARSYIPRQIISLFIVTLLGIHVLYLLFASASYYFIFNHEMMLHPRFLPKQVRMEIRTSLEAFPVMILLTLPWFLAEVRGWSKLYASVDDHWGGWWYLVASVPFYLLFTDYCIYWVHRWLHHPLLYKFLHKPHHKWIVPTPFASYAFHPLDGYLQSVPYHLFIFLFPMHRYLYLGFFVAVNFWAIFIHDSDMITGHPSKMLSTYFTWADRAGNSYRHPDATLDPLLEVKMRDRGKREGKAKSD